MSSLTTNEGADTHVWRRVLGVHDAGIPGTTLVALGGIHGNEPAGVHALLRVLEKMHNERLAIRGRFVALCGNLQALESGRRFIDRDLNRAWLADNLRALSERDTAQDGAEDREQRELLEVLDQLRSEARGPMVFLDLHTSSAPGASFACMSDTLANREIAYALQVPLILGLEECIDGAIMEYFNRHHSVAVAVEGGCEADPTSIDNLESAVWTSLSAAGMLSPGAVDLSFHQGRLRESAAGLPSVLEICHRHEIEKGDVFEMVPGFESFDEVEKGRLLARSDGQPLIAPKRCRVLLPLYQGQGDDGYFLVRSVGRFWLTLAAVLRRCRLQSIVHWLPGVRRHPDEPHTLLVRGFAKRLFAVELFHLLGFRKRREVDGQLSFARRPDPVLDS